MCVWGGGGGVKVILMDFKKEYYCKDSAHNPLWIFALTVGISTVFRRTWGGGGGGGGSQAQPHQVYVCEIYGSWPCGEVRHCLYGTS